MKFRNKLTISFLLIGIVSSQIIFWQMYHFAKNDLEKATFDKLTAIRENKKDRIEHYFDLIAKQTEQLASTPWVTAALIDLHDAYHLATIVPEKITHVNEELTAYYTRRSDSNNIQTSANNTTLPQSLSSLALQYHYVISANTSSLPINSTSAAQIAEYSQLHQQIDQRFQSFIDRFNFSDIFLVDQEGNIVYSAKKNTDFATNLLSGPYKDSHLAVSFRQTRAITDQNLATAIITGFTPYSPARNKPTSFVAVPIFSNNRPQGVLIVKLRIDAINKVMTNKSQWLQDGLGKTGETYLVGPDFTMRNDSRFFLETPQQFKNELQQFKVDEADITQIFQSDTTVLLQEVKTAATIDAFEGNTDTKIITDYRNIQVLSSYTPLSIAGLNWVIVSEIDAKEVFAPVSSFTWYATLTIGLLTVAIFFFSRLFSKQANIGLMQLQHGIRQIIHSDFSAKIQLKSGDEFEQLAKRFNEMAEHLLTTTTSKDDLLTEVEERKKAEQEKEKSITELQNALNEIEVLQGVVPICSYCKKLRDDKGYWNNVEQYLRTAKDADFTHSICPDCATQHFPDMEIYPDDSGEEQRSN